MPITYSISGGADAARFMIDDSTGKLTFKAAPDFEAPGDANKDNVYELTVKVADSNGKTTTKDLRVSCTDVADMNANSPPQITSAATASVPENTTAVMTVTAVESDGSGGSGGSGSGTTDTRGKITNYSQQACQIDAGMFESACAYLPHSIQKVDDYELRFELRQGERMHWDGDYCERSSYQQSNKLGGGLPPYIPFGATLSQEYRLFIEPGQDAASYFFVISQAHNDDMTGAHPGVGTSPPLTVAYEQSKIQFHVMHCPTGQNPGNDAGNVKKITVWVDPQKTTRGVWHQIKVEAKNQNDSSGYCKAWFDGTEVANYTGPVGYGDALYWEFGPYRATDPTVFAVHYRNIVHT